MPVTNSPPAEAPLAVGSVGNLAIPAEDCETPQTGTELDLSGPPIIRKPGGFEWVTLLIDVALNSRLLKRPKPGKGFEVEYFWVESSLRHDIGEHIKPFRIVPYYSWQHERIDLWVTPISEPGRSWGDSLSVLLNQSKEWHAGHQIVITADTDKARYRVRSLPVPVNKAVAVPEARTEELLGVALGERRIIKSASHPVFLELTMGDVL